MSLIKIVSGGQTGVDRGALDAALVAGFPCGGWCPPGREAEDGPIPDRYPLTPLPGGDIGEVQRKNSGASAAQTARQLAERYRARTLKNVQDSGSKAVVRKQLKRTQMAGFFVNLPACLIGMEACGSAHFWARQLTALGHSVKIMAPQFVKPYVKSNKNDVADAEAICEAVARPNMRFVPIKNAEQQAVLALHRARQGFIVERTAQGNQLRGLLAEFGLSIPLGFKALTAMMPQILESHEDDLPGLSRDLFSRLFTHFRELDRQVKELDSQLQAWHREDAASRRLQKIPGVGPLTASALVASVSDAKTFKNGRQFAAWLGLVPRQQSSGGKERLLGISKRGDTYLRTLLIHGARAVVRHLKPSAGEPQGWLARVANRRNPNIAAVALANKNARIVWAMLAHDRDYQTGYIGARPGTICAA